MMDWKDEIRKTIYRQIPKEKADSLDFEDSVQLHKQGSNSSLPIWERTADAVRKELLAAEERKRRQQFEVGEERSEDRESDIYKTDQAEEMTEEGSRASASDHAADETKEREPEKNSSEDVSAVKNESTTADDSTLEREAASRDRMNEARAFLFKENMRLEGLRSELSKASKMLQQQADVLKAEEELLNAQKERFEKEKDEFRTEMKDLNEQIRQSRQKLTDDQALFDKKYKVLEMGFAKLNADKKDFEAQKRAFEYKKKFLQDAERFDPVDFASVTEGEEFIFFKGVSHPLAVKKRYKELIKIYHPDNSDGDKYILQRINWEYDRLRKRM